MGKPRPIDTFRHELTSAIAEQFESLSHPVDREVLKGVIRRITDAWRVEREDSMSSIPGEEGKVWGYEFEVTLPWRPESEQETEAREARWAAMVWDPEDGPPMPGVTMLQLLRQDTWWMYHPKPYWEGSSPLLSVRVENMTHSHRMAVLAWLRSRANELHAQVAGELLGAPDDVWSSYDVELPEEWLEEQELVWALDRWTTPWAESPLTWKPITEAPCDGTVIMAADMQANDAFRIKWDSYWRGWIIVDDGPLYGTPPSCVIYRWRDLREDEKPAPVLACEHYGYDETDCGSCGAVWYPCDHGGVHGSAECSACDQE
jgi:hypothetical protein